MAVKRGQLQMLLVLFRAVMAARKRQDQRIIALDLAEPARCARLIGQLIVRKNVSGYKVITHDWIPSTDAGEPASTRRHAIRSTH
jgi:hypothetical protein